VIRRLIAGLDSGIGSLSCAQLRQRGLLAHIDRRSKSSRGRDNSPSQITITNNGQLAAPPPLRTFCHWKTFREFLQRTGGGVLQRHSDIIGYQVSPSLLSGQTATATIRRQVSTSLAI